MRRMAAKIVCLVMLACVPTIGTAASEDDIVGAWLTEDGESKVEISRSGTSYSGKAVWLKAEAAGSKPLRDTKNADPELRGRPLLGIEVLSGVTYAGDGIWKGGTVYSPRKGKPYPVELSIGSDGKLNVKAKAGPLSRTVQWTR